MFSSFKSPAPLALLSASLLSAPDEVILGQETLEWKSIPQGRMTSLNPASQGGDGFEDLDPASLGIGFVNVLEKKYQEINQNLLNGSGVALGDVNGDELCDIFLAGLNSESRLYLNQGNWKFKDATKASGIVLSNALATGVMLEDVDGDNDLDLLVNVNSAGTRLWHNDGKGHFTESTPASFLSQTGPTSFSLADINGDHRLDLYVANYGANTIRSGAAVRVRTVRGKQVVTGRWRDRIEIIDGQMVEFGEPDHLFIQDNNGNFQMAPWKEERFKHADGTTIEQPFRDLSLSSMFHDLNRDGLPDLYVCNDFHSPDRIWINQGDGRFLAMDENAIRTTCHFSMGVDIADVDRNGLDDLFVVDMLSRSHQLRMTQKTEMSPNPNYLEPFEKFASQVRRNTLLIQRKDGSYAELARLAGVEASDWSWCPVFMDVDLDGWQDLLVVNGHAMDALDSDTLEKRNKLPGNSPQRRMIGYPGLTTANVAFRNLGNLTFEPAGDQWQFNSTKIGNGMATGDLDNDGDLDVVVNCLNASPLIYRNTSSKPRVTVRLKGHKSNTSGIGARMRLIGPGQSQEQEMIAGGRYLSDDQNIRTFALPDPETDYQLEVQWPDGSKTTMPRVKAGSLYEISASAAKGGEKSNQIESQQNPQTIFSKSELTIPIHQPANEKMDWEWQPAINRSIRRQAVQALVEKDPQTSNDVLISPSITQEKKSGRKPDSNTSMPPHEAMAWVDAKLQPNISFHPHDSEHAPEVRRSPIHSTAPYAMADVDKDGDLDVFVGMPPLPGKYPESGGSQLLIHEEGPFQALDAHNIFDQVGNVQDVVFGDLDGNGWEDLVIACEWSPIRVFLNNAGEWTEHTDALGLSPYQGWWRALTVLDVDHDGDLDLIAGNWGNNTRYQSTIQHGIRWYYGDANMDGFMEGMESYFDPARRAWLPFDGLEQQERVFTTIRQHYASHRQFADSTTLQILKAIGLPEQYVEITTLSSMLFIQENGKFTPSPLPAEAQWSPVNDIVASDFDMDGHQDLFIAQNWEQVPSHLSRMDAGRGLILLGDGKGQFRPLSSQTSGIRVDAEQRAAWTGDANGDQRPDLWIQTPDTIHLFLRTDSNH